MTDQSTSHFHVAFFVPTFAGGGAERVMVTLANAFVESGHRIDLLLTSRRELKSESVSPEVSVVDFERSHTWQTIPDLIQTLRQRQPDVLVSALYGATVAAYSATAWMRTWGERVPSLCATVHSLLPRTESQGVRAHLLVHTAHVVLRRVETAVAVSRSVAQDLATHVGRARERTDVIHNPIDIDAVQSEAKADSPHDWFQEDVPVIVSAGRLHPEKDYGTLLQALARLHETKRVRAIILGEGPKRKDLEEQSRELGIFPDTTFPGFVENPYAFMKRADVFALPSASEAFGNVVVEALACGTPVVATESGGPVEILHTNEATYGSLVPPHDPVALADALTHILNRSVDHSHLQRRARDFDVSEAVDRYHALFERIDREAP